MKYITKSKIKKYDTRVFVRKDCNINGKQYAAGTNLRWEDVLSENEVYSLLKEGCLSLAAPEVARVTTLKELPNIGVGSVFYTPKFNNGDRSVFEPVQFGDLCTMTIKEIEKHTDWFLIEIEANKQLDEYCFVEGCE